MRARALHTRPQIQLCRLHMWKPDTPNESHCYYFQSHAHIQLYQVSSVSSRHDSSLYHCMVRYPYGMQYVQCIAIHVHCCAVTLRPCLEGGDRIWKQSSGNRIHKPNMAAKVQDNVQYTARRMQCPAASSPASPLKYYSQVSFSIIKTTLYLLSAQGARCASRTSQTISGARCRQSASTTLARGRHSRSRLAHL